MPNAKFDSKSFNAEAFRYKVGTIPNLKMNELKKSAALAGNPDIKAVFASENGTGYTDWKALQDVAHGAGTVDKMRKMGYNESADQKRFASYKARLGKEAPHTFEDFQKLKYDSPVIMPQRL